MPEFCGATLDSRLVKPGMLFVAVKGERVDGHDFIPQARAAGAAGIVDGREELARVAAEYRRTLKAKVIGITGSAGKTTTKELVAAFLRAGGFRVHATEGNFNNDLGLPLTILNCPPDAEFLVVEMGTNHPGEIAYLVDIARPDAGVISSEKGTLFARLPPDGFAVVGVNNDRYERLRAMSAARVVAVDPSDEVGARLASALAPRLPGAHNVSNARLAAACAGEFGVPLDRCVAALEDFALPGDRWRVTERDGVTYVNDCYNANPTSMIAALETFAAMPCAGRRVAVLGDMFELGAQSGELHARVLARAAELPLDARCCSRRRMACTWRRCSHERARVRRGEKRRGGGGAAAARRLRSRRSATLPRGARRGARARRRRRVSGRHVGPRGDESGRAAHAPVAGRGARGGRAGDQRT